MKISKRKLLWLAPLGIAGLTAGVLAALNPGIEAQTSPDHPDPKMRTRFYSVDLQTVRAAVLEIIPQLQSYGAHWRLVAADSENKIAAEVPVLMFTDDLTVTLRESENGTRADVHSQTQVHGKSDFGENRRHILQLLLVLDEKLNARN
jgi:uncharacterized protein (DUF1499 family)